MKQKDLVRPGLVLLSLCLLVGLPAHVGAQAAPVDQESPRVQAVRFEGVESLDPGMLGDSIATQETRCRGILLRPFCAISDAGVFVEKHDLDREELELDEIRLRVVYFRRGYRQARVESTVEPEGDGVSVTFVVEEGPLTRVGELVVLQTDSLLSAGQLRRADLPAAGEALDLTRLDSARIRMRGWLWDRGHADAEINDSVTFVDSLARSATLRVRIDPGPVTTIEQVSIEGNERVSERTVRRLLELAPGDLYRRGDMTAAQRRLYETELFRQAVIRVPSTADSAKTVNVTLQEAPPRAIQAGPGFNTVEFVQAEVRFTRYDWLGGARRLDVRGALGNLLAPQLYGRSIFGSAVPEGVGDDVASAFLEPTWFVGVNVTQPFFFSTRNSVGVGVSAHRRSIPGIVIDRGLAAHASITRRVADHLPVSLTYQFEETRIEAGELYFCVSFGVCDPATIGGLGEPHRLSPVRLTARLERSDDLLAPTAGFTVHVEAEHASQLTLSDFHHQRITADLTRYMRLGPGVLAGRVRGGWVRALEGTFLSFGLPAGSLEVLHPRRRLLAGGARSVRGFAENQLGPRVLTVPADELIRPRDDAGEACTATTVADGTCDPDGVPSDAFQPRPLGGNTLLEGSVEYRHPLSETLTGAVFVDAGLLRGQRLNFPPGSRSAVTPGVGIRYRSPIGPVRLDLGVRPSVVEELPVVTAVGEDGESQLVQLETMKRYDPVAGSGFLGQILSRLQLHLAIGEAF